MDMLRKFIFLGLLVAAGSPVVGQNYNADRVDRPNTKKNKYRYQSRLQLFHVHGV